jgi:hypothetical protein
MAGVGVGTSGEARRVSYLNDLFGQELGRTLHGDPIYSWFWSDSLTRPKRVYANTDEGYQLSYIRTERIVKTGIPFIGDKLISVMEPHYVVEPLLPTIRNRYVLCVWIAAQSFEEWRKQFDDTMEWPKGGEYFPVSTAHTTAYLDVGKVPTKDQTWQVIRWVREDKDKALTFFQALDVYADNDRARIKAEQEKAMHTLDNILPAYDNIPGTRSGPISFLAETKPDSRIQQSDLVKMFGDAIDINSIKPLPKVRADKSLVTV